MPFSPHTEDDISTMLDAIGADSVDDLFDEIPDGLRIGSLQSIPEALSEMQVTRLMHARAAQDGQLINFIGAGAYEHHVPAAVWQITTRGEFYTAYTPYQAEASQGTLQLIYEYQTMMTRLTGMDVSNASLYDGASGLAEAILMAVRGNRKSRSKRVLCLGSVNPRYRDTVRAIAGPQGIELVEIDFDGGSGTSAVSALGQYAGEDFAALVIQQPNYFGALEAVDALTDWAHDNGSLVIGVVNPTSLALLKPPGKWGTKGADIACGEGQPLGVPLSSGGPYFGFLTCKQPLVRQIPGRIVGRTVDMEGRTGYTLTLQAREQHIRRSKATSNICTNQGLVVTAATIYMTLVGSEGLRRVAAASHANTTRLVDACTSINGVERQFPAPHFHEAVLRLPAAADQVLSDLAIAGIAGGVHLGADYPALKNCVLVCATETRTEEDIQLYAGTLARSLERAQVA
ncbi:MAG: aminomethyl-transferring glycine dehydrogenase subunit GcvPA [Xanthomonadales bacterium]|nr:aminomethyl-transferring glycine dehydrogenase subunit GcvPA [Xanthomonadales bacterium]